MADLTERGMQRRIEAFFDKLAPTWDHEVAAPFAPRLAEMLDELGISPGDTVLDVGAGTGVLAGLLVDRVGPRGRIIAVDLSRGMLHEGKTLRRNDPIAWVQADVLDAPFPASVFDWVLCYSVFPHFLDQQLAVNRFASLLKPGGSLAVLHSQSREAINEHHEKVGDVVGGHILPDDDGMARLIRNAGLELLRLENTEDGFIALARRPASAQ